MGFGSSTNGFVFDGCCWARGEGREGRIIVIWSVLIALDEPKKLIVIWKAAGILIFILLAEIRTHGVGFYQFAKDEESRKEQLEALKDMRDKVRSCCLSSQISPTTLGTHTHVLLLWNFPCCITVNIPVHTVCQFFSARIHFPLYSREYQIHEKCNCVNLAHSC